LTRRKREEDPGSHGFRRRDRLRLPAAATPPGIAAVQRALMWAVGAGGAIVFIEPSPYELMTLASVVFFFATGLRMRPVFIPLLILLFC
jgi:hypothetical protein